MLIRISPGLPRSRHGQATGSVLIRVLSWQSGGRPWLCRGYSGAKSWLVWLQNVPDCPGRDTDDTRTPHGLPGWVTDNTRFHPDNAGLTPDCNATRTAPDRPGCFKHFETSGDDPGPSRTTKDQPRITPDHQGPAKDEPRICHGLTRTTPDSWSGVVRGLIRVCLTGA